MTATATDLTPTEHARCWVLDQSAGTFFWLNDVPAPPQVASVMLSRLTRQGDPPPVQRLANGFYWRVPDRDSPRMSRDPVLTAMVYAGHGSGFADVSAVNVVGWSQQAPAREWIATLNRRRPIDRRIRYAHRSNQRRERLSFAEVAVLEAVRCWAAAHVCWDEAVERVSDGTSLSRLGYTAVIRSDAIRWAGETEQALGGMWVPYRPPCDFRERIEDLCDRIPDLQGPHRG